MVTSVREPVSVRVGASPVIEIHGEINEVSAPMIVKAARQLIRADVRQLNIDCTTVELSDDDGFSTILNVQKLAEAVGGRVHLIYPPTPLLDALRRAGSAHGFEIDEIHFLGSHPTSSNPGGWSVGHFSVPGTLDHVAWIRHNVARLAKTMTFTDDQVEDIMLAVGEAASNAVRYGCPEMEKNQVSVCCEHTDHSLVVKLSDQGPGFDPFMRSKDGHDMLLEGGRGLILMNLLMDEVDFIFAQGTTVRMVKWISMH